MSRWRGRKWQFWGHQSVALVGSSGVEELLKELTTQPHWKSSPHHHWLRVIFHQLLSPQGTLGQSRKISFWDKSALFFIEVTNTAIKSITTMAMTRARVNLYRYCHTGGCCCDPWVESKAISSDLEANGSGSVKPVRALRADLSWLWPFYNLSLHKEEEEGEVEDKKKEKKR